MPGQGDRFGAVHPEGPPVVAVQVERNHIPPPVRRDEPMGFRPPTGFDAVAGAVGEGHPLMNIACPRNETSCSAGTASIRGIRATVDAAKRDELASKTRREEPVQLGQGAQSAALDPGDRHARHYAEDHSDRGSFLLVEEEWRNLTADSQPVPSRRPGVCVDLVAEAPQTLDVSPDGSGIDTQSAGQLGSTPGGAALEQAQQSEESGRGVGQAPKISWIADRFCPHPFVA